MEDSQDTVALQSATQVTRRTAIKSSVGMLGLSAIGLGSAAEDLDSQSKSTVGETVFGEVGFTLKNPQVDAVGHQDPLPRYGYDEDSQEVVFTLLSDETRELIQSNSAVVRANSYESLPHIVNTGRTGKTVPLKTNEQLTTTQVALLDSEIQFPAIRVRELSENRIEIAHQDERVVASPEEAVGLDVATPGRGQNPDDLELRYVAQNYGQVSVAEIEEEDQ